MKWAEQACSCCAEVVVKHTAVHNKDTHWTTVMGTPARFSKSGQLARLTNESALLALKPFSFKFPKLAKLAI